MLWRRASIGCVLQRTPRKHADLSQHVVLPGGNSNLHPEGNPYDDRSGSQFNYPSQQLAVQQTLGSESCMVSPDA